MQGARGKSGRGPGGIGLRRDLEELFAAEGEIASAGAQLPRRQAYQAEQARKWQAKRGEDAEGRGSSVGQSLDWGPWLWLWR
jgi:hypothetical protein